MKTLKKLVLAIAGTLMISFSYAQNYKAPTIDASGKVMNGKGIQIGSVTTSGEVMNIKGEKIASIDANGTLVDAKTGKKLGKAEKNGNFTFYSDSKGEKTFIVSPPANGTCLVKNKKGKIVAEIHENYKMYGACAAHCLQNHMKHGEVMKMK